MWLESVSQSEDHAETCPTCGGGVQRRVYGEMHGGTFIQDGERVDIRGTPQAWFRNPIVLDAITQYFDGGLYKLWPGDRYHARGGKRLHLMVWEAVYGSRPEGCHIHHRDGNSANNALHNLACLPIAEHLSETWHRTKHLRTNNFSPLARERSLAWHSTEAGQLWHRQHALKHRNWTKWKRVEQPCEHCGKPYMALQRQGNTQRYCSEACRVDAYHARLKEANTLKYLPRPCVVCGQEFAPPQTRGMHHQKYCSKVCSNREHHTRQNTKRKAARAARRASRNPA